jgi:hypothetical protein
LQNKDTPLQREMFFDSLSVFKETFNFFGVPMKDARWMASLKLTSRALTFMVRLYAPIPEGKLALPSGDFRSYPSRTVLSK